MKGRRYLRAVAKKLLKDLQDPQCVGYALHYRVDGEEKIRPFTKENLVQFLTCELETEK